MIADKHAAANATGLFRIVDRGESRRDLASRTEVKFTLQDADVNKLRMLLAGRCRREIYKHPVSVVHSLYFDDARLSACYANLNGNGQRRKLRLRWYDSQLAPDNFFFEIKWRNNRVTGKHRFQIRSQQPLHTLTFKQISRQLFKIAPPEFVRDLVNFADPIVVVQYRRQHFVSNDRALRLTLDYDLTYFDQRGRQSFSTSFGKRLEGLVVMEGKTPVGREFELRRLIHPFTPRAGRCSKYVHGCQVLGHIRANI